jgi:NUMOD3 motif-containing protein
MKDFEPHLSVVIRESAPEKSLVDKKRGRPFGFKHTNESKAKASASLKTSEAAVNARARLHAENRGKKRSYEQRIRMSAAHLGKTHTDEAKLKMSKAHVEQWRRRKASQPQIIFPNSDPNTPTN